MIPVLATVAVLALEGFLLWRLVGMLRKIDQVSSRFEQHLEEYRQRFGHRVDARQYVQSMATDSARMDRLKAGGQVVGSSLANGSLAAASLLAMGVAVVEGAVGLAQNVQRAGERALAREGAKSDDQMRCEGKLRAELERLWGLRTSVSRLKTGIVVLGIAGGIVVIALALA